MCGIICSKYNINDALKRLHHRGPNSSAILKVKQLNFGFVRLAINDKTPKGMQPFQYKHYVALFNAEIYNYKELILKYNLEVNSQSDTEVILPLFEKFGVEIINLLDGFYSGVIFDTKRLKLYTIRDFIGKKPLFLIESNNEKFISSELKIFDKIHHFQIIPKGFSYIENFQKINLIKSYSYETSNNNLDNLLHSAVKKRIPCEQFGIFLSGGIDSSIIAYIALKYSKNIQFYTLANPDSRDFKSVQLLKEHLHIKNLKFIELPNKEILKRLIKEVVYHTESYNPSIISNGIGTYLLSKEAQKDGLKVVLGGDGADEVFSGYTGIYKENIKIKDRLLNDLHFTVLRRIDTCSMAHSIELRVPYLDRKLVSFSNNLEESQLKNKKILRDTFVDHLPLYITQREKISFDRGSGLRKGIVSILRENGLSEKENLFKIWKEFFHIEESTNPYFHSYPVFDKYITNRSES